MDLMGRPLRWVAVGSPGMVLSMYPVMCICTNSTAAEGDEAQ